MLLLPLSIPRRARRGRQRGAVPVLLAAVLLCVVPVSAIHPARSNCPHVDCAREKRKFCRLGSSQCGPCLLLFEENEEGNCVTRRRHDPRGKVTLYPNLDEEIDYLQSIIEKQQVTEIKQPRRQPKHDDALSSQADASKHGLNSQGRLSDGGPRATAEPPRPALPDTPTPKPMATPVMGRAGPAAGPPSWKDNLIVIIVCLCVAFATITVILASVCYIKSRKDSRLADKVDYPAFGGVAVPAAGANGTSMGDKTLAQSAQMYHYQHQKQQMLSMGNHKPEQKSHDTEVTSDEEDVGGDFTVYECPGLAPTGEMEVKNPLFDDSDLQFQGNHK